MASTAVEFSVLVKATADGAERQIPFLVPLSLALSGPEWTVGFARALRLNRAFTVAAAGGPDMTRESSNFRVFSVSTAPVVDMVRALTLHRVFDVSTALVVAFGRRLRRFFAFSVSGSGAAALTRRAFVSVVFNVQAAVSAVWEFVFSGPATYKVASWLRRRQRISRSGLFRYFSVDVGGTLLREGGVWSVVESPTESRLAAAEVVLRGGHDTPVTDEIAAELVSAGFGDAVTEVPIIRRGY